MDILKETSNKFRYASMRTKKEIDECDPSRHRMKATLTRSNSLDSMHIRTSDNREKNDDIDGDIMSRTQKDSSEDTPADAKKGILKRRNSFSMGSSTTPVVSPPVTPYQTITAGDTSPRRNSLDLNPEAEKEVRLRSAFDKVRKMKMGTATSMELKLSQISLFKPKKKEKDHKAKPVLDLMDEERSTWEMEQLAMPVDFSKVQIDPAPFQLVERTSLLRVHSMFSMLGINHAYVTTIGRLIGVVALVELRAAIEGQYVGRNQQQSITPQASQPTTPTSPLRSSLGSGPSPQRMSTIPSYGPHSDPESGNLSHRGSRVPLVNFSNGIALS